MNELRTAKTDIWHIRSGDSKSSDLQIAGYAARYNKFSTDEGLPFKEVIRPGAFSKILAKNPDVVCLLNHDPNMVLGRTSAGTLTLMNDQNGLKFVCSLPDTELGHSTRESVKRGDIAGCSFSFNVGPDDVEWRYASDMINDPCDDDDDDCDDELYRCMRSKTVMPDDTSVRVINNFSQVHDVGPVTFPAYSSTSVVARSMDWKTVVESAPVEMRSRMLDRLVNQFNERLVGSRRRRLLDIA
jgi:HK97 family phage prohead protease